MREGGEGLISCMAVVLRRAVITTVIVGGSFLRTVFVRLFVCSGAGLGKNTIKGRRLTRSQSCNL